MDAVLQWDVVFVAVLPDHDYELCVVFRTKSRTGSTGIYSTNVQSKGVRENAKN